MRSCCLDFCLAFLWVLLSNMGSFSELPPSWIGSSSSSITMGVICLGSSAVFRLILTGASPRLLRGCVAIPGIELRLTGCLLMDSLDVGGLRDVPETNGPSMSSDETVRSIKGGIDLRAMQTPLRIPLVTCKGWIAAPNHIVMIIFLAFYQET